MMVVTDRNTTQRGESLVSFLVSVLLASIALTTAVSGISGFTRGGVDSKIIGESQDYARQIMDLMSYELRQMGSGVPMYQSGFSITTSGLGNATLPILTSSNDTQIDFRLNERGRSTVTTTATFNPASGSSFNVLSSADLAVGDTIYLSNVLVGGTHGLQGVVGSIASNTITLSGTSVYSAGATFASGTTVEPVSTVSYTNSAGGIIRSVGTSSLIIAPRSSFTASYMDSAGTAIALPLTASSIASSLASVSLTVNVQGSSTIGSGSTYTATLTSRIGLRNIIAQR